MLSKELRGGIWNADDLGEFTEACMNKQGYNLNRDSQRCQHDRNSEAVTKCYYRNNFWGCPWENDYCESFNGKLRDELLIGEIFCSLEKSQILIEQWCKHYNPIRPHSSPGYRPPAPRASSPSPQPLDQATPMQ